MQVFNSICPVLDVSGPRLFFMIHAVGFVGVPQVLIGVPMVLLSLPYGENL